MKTPQPYQHAFGHASRILDALTPAILRGEVAGSIRRQRPTVGDIEIVVIPAYLQDLLGEQGESLLELRLEQLILAGVLAKGERDGPKFKQLHVPAAGMTLDLWIVTPETWGVQLAIRTGPEEFARKLVIEQSRGGYLPDGHAVKDGRVWSRAVRNLEGEVESVTDPIPTPEEVDFLRLLRCGWVAPWNREPKPQPAPHTPAW